MELDLQSLFWLLCTGWDPAIPSPLPAFGLIYEGAYLVSYDRRHLFVTPCLHVRTVYTDREFLKSLWKRGTEEEYRVIVPARQAT
jgi:hypothetical protein